MDQTAVEHRARSGSGAAVAGMLLIAATYGMARFGVGLFAPQLVTQRPELAGVIGWAAAAQFTSYSLAAVAAARFVDRAPRTGLILAGATATIGCLGVAVAQDPLVFVAAVFIGGMGGGFASPALVPVIDAATSSRASSTAQSLVNSGTAVGVIGTGMVAALATSVGSAWLVMALICAAAGTAAWHSGRPRRHTLNSGTMPSAFNTETRRPPGRWRPLFVPGVAAMIAGLGSALIWTFGPLLITEAGSVSTDHVGWLWIALGLGGLLGIFTGTLVRRLGTRSAWCLFAGALALASAGLSVSVATGTAWAAFASMAVFGAGYMALSGTLILWARIIWPGSAGAGTSVLFVALATGQALGSAGFGVAKDVLPPATLAVLAAGLCIAGGLMGLIQQRRRA